MSEAAAGENPRRDRCELFVDEAGGPEIFDKKGRPIVGTEGCSRFFLLGMLEVDEPERLATALTELREQMKRDPYFASLESFKPERRKTAVLFHAKDDVPDVRVKVLDLLRSFVSALHFRAVVCDKEEIRRREERIRKEAPGYLYKPDHLYDELARSLFGRFSRTPDQFRLWIAKRGNKDRNAALRSALEQAEGDFAQRFGFSRGGADSWQTTVTTPERVICLQAVDYFLWAVQRFYEPRKHPQTGEVLHEDRYLMAIWPQVSQIYDMHFGSSGGTHFTTAQPLTLEARFEPKPKKKKKP